MDTQHFFDKLSKLLSPKFTMIAFAFGISAIALCLQFSTPQALNSSRQDWPTKDGTYDYKFEVTNPTLETVFLNFSVSLHCTSRHRNAPIAFRDITIELKPLETKTHTEKFHIPNGSWVAVAHHRLNKAASQFDIEREQPQTPEEQGRGIVPSLALESWK